MKKISIRQNIFISLLFAYCILLFLFMVIKIYPTGELSVTIRGIQENRAMGYWNFNIIPFRTLKYQIMNLSFSFDILIAHLICFIPFGVFIPKLSKKNKSYLSSLIKFLIICTGIELFQFITMTGFFDIDDIILNTVSFSIGYLIFSKLNISVE